MKFPSFIPTLKDFLLTNFFGALIPAIIAWQTSLICTTGRLGVPSLKISILPVV